MIIAQFCVVRFHPGEGVSPHHPRNPHPIKRREVGGESEENAEKGREEKRKERRQEKRREEKRERESTI